MIKFNCLVGVLIFSISQLFADSPLLKSGPMVGYSEMAEVMLWAQTSASAKVQFSYWEKDNPSKKYLSDVVLTSEEKYFTAHIPIKNLKAGTIYNYELLINGKIVPLNYLLQFQTQKHWQWRSPAPDFTFAFGSCVYVNDPPFDRPGTPYGVEIPIFDEILKHNPDFMLWLGDNIYYREGDWYSKSGMLYRYTNSRSYKPMQPLLGSIHNYAIWDDHDYGRNDDDRSYRMKDFTLDLFKSFWANPSYGLQNTPGVFTRFVWGDAEFFLLDDRFYRSPNNSPTDENKVMFGKEQFNWLKDALANSDATFKFVVNGNQMINNYPNKEGLNHFPSEYNELRIFLKRAKIPGVVFISGDLHWSEMLEVTDSTFYTLHEVTSSSLTAGLSKPNAQSDFRIPNSLIADKHSFGIIKISGEKENRKALIELIDYTGTKRFSLEIFANLLKPKSVK